MLKEGRRLVAGVDEVGRGAWAGPVVVGVVVVDQTIRPAPAGTKDSKLLARPVREQLAPRIKSWCAAWAIGEVTAKEIDRIGMTAALGLAARRAIDSLPEAPDAVILDGPFDYISRALDETRALLAPITEVHTRIGADLSCSSVAAASVIAKVLRDDKMRDLSTVHPGYGFDVHAGYGTRAHSSAIGDKGLCIEHRSSWAIQAARSNDGAFVATTSVDVC